MRETKPFYRQNLPHFLPNDRPYFLTFRLAGSIPVDEEQLGILLKLKFMEYGPVILDTIKSGIRIG